VETQKGSAIHTESQYNITKQLIKETEFLWHVNRYIEDATREGNEEYVKVFEEIETDKKSTSRYKETLLQSLLLILRKIN
jgi:hypothetical protein